MTHDAERIVSLVARRLDVRMKKPFGIAGGAQTEAKNILVELTLAGGIQGFGEGAPFPAFNGETQEDALAACALAGPRLEGCLIEEDSWVSERLAASYFADSPSARCAIETALFDARARLAGVSLRSWFGGNRALEEIVTDITITTGTIEEAAREALAFHAFGTLKIKVGAGDVDIDIARVHAVRAARPDARLIVDANGGFSVDDAVRFSIAVKEANIALFEQPVAETKGSWDALVEVRRRSGLRIALDESITCAADVDDAAAHHAADAINVKIMKSGIFEALKIIESTRKAGLDRMIGGMVETRLAMGMSACIAAGIGGFAIVDLDTPLFLAEDPFEGGYVQEGERIDLRPITLGHGTTPRSAPSTE